MTQRSSFGVSFVKMMNQRAILDAIYESENTSRTELSRSLAMSKPAISDNLLDLIRIGLVREIGEGAGTQNGGRRPMMLEFNKNSKYVIAIDLNYSNPVFALGNLKNEILNEFDVQIANTATRESYVTVIESGVRILMNSSGCDPKNVLCIAIASPGVFDEMGNLCSVNPRYAGIQWDTVGLRESLQETFRLNVIMKNDIKTATVGEWVYGVGRGTDNLLYISSGVGLGAGIVLDGKLYEGARFTAGEIYNQFSSMECLKRGETLEDDICMKSLLLKCSRVMPEDARGFGDIIEAYGRKDARVREIISSLCDRICVMALNYVNLMDIDEVIFGGEYAAFGETFVEEFEKYFKGYCHHAPLVKVAALGKYSGIYGLFYLARQMYFDMVCNQNLSSVG